MRRRESQAKIVVAAVEAEAQRGSRSDPSAKSRIVRGE